MNWFPAAVLSVKVEVTWICTAPSRETSKAHRHGSHSFTCKQHHACLYLVSVHQMSLPLIVVTDIYLQLTTHLLTPKGWKAELAVLQRTVYPYKWSPFSCRLSAGQGKFAGQRPAFYLSTMQPTNSTANLVISSAWLKVSSTQSVLLEQM